MNWSDYLRGFEEGRYEGSVSGRSSGLLGALLQLVFVLVFAAVGLVWLICKGTVIALWTIVKILAGRA